MASVRDIAREAGVSIGTVSRVLNNSPRVSEGARAKVLAAANRSGYVASVGKRSTANLGLIYMGQPSPGSPFDAAVVQGIFEVAGQRGFDVILLDARLSRQPGETFSQMFMRKGIQAAVLRADETSGPLIEQVSAEGFPVVLVGGRVEQEGLSYVYSDSRPASREAVEHLISLGHRRIGFVTNVVDDGDHDDRYTGYITAMEAAGLPVEERMVFRTPASRAGGEALANRLLVTPDRPTALFVADPLSAVGVVKQAQVLGLSLPRDLAVVGFDDSDVRFLSHPTMTAVCQDATKLGVEAAQLVIEQLENEHRPTVRRTLNAWLEVHGTSASPPVAGGESGASG